MLLTDALKNIASKKRDKKDKKGALVKTSGKDGAKTSEPSSMIVRPKTAIVPTIKTSYYKSINVSIVPKQGGEEGSYGALVKTLDSVVENVNTLTQIKQNEIANEKRKSDAQAKSLQDAQKKSKEEKSEIKDQKSVVKKSLKIAGPKSSLFDGALNFLKTFVFSTAIMQLLNWFSDPQKTEPIFKFLEDNFVAMFVGTMAVVGAIASASLLSMGGMLTLGLPLFFKLAGLFASVLLSPVGLVALSAFGLYKLTGFIKKDVREKRNRKLAASLIEEGLTPQEAIARTEKKLKEAESKFFKYGGGGRGHRNKYKINLIKEDLEFLRSLLSKPSVEKVSERIPQLPPTGTVHGQEYGASRDGGARKHAGTDYDIGPNDTFYSQIGGEVTNIGYDPNGYGNYVDIYNEELDKTERIAEGKNVLVAKGDMISPGQAVVQGETETGVIHYEIREGKKTTFGFPGTVDPIKFLDNLKSKRTNNDQASSVSKKASYEEQVAQTLIVPIASGGGGRQGPGGSTQFAMISGGEGMLNRVYDHTIQSTLYNA